MRESREPPQSPIKSVPPGRRIFRREGETGFQSGFLNLEAGEGVAGLAGDLTCGEYGLLVEGPIKIRGSTVKLLVSTHELRFVHAGANARGALATRAPPAGISEVWPGQVLLLSPAAADFKGVLTVQLEEVAGDGEGSAAGPGQARAEVISGRVWLEEPAGYDPAYGGGGGGTMPAAALQADKVPQPHWRRCNSAAVGGAPSSDRHHRHRRHHRRPAPSTP